MTASEHPAASSPAPDPPDGSGESAFWSPWATVGWSLAISTVFVFVQLAVMVVWNLARTLRTAGEDAFPAATSSPVSGDLIATATLVSALVCGGLVVALTALKPGARIAQALALRRPAPIELARWLSLTVLLIVLIDSLSWVLGRPIVPDFMVETVQSASTPALLWLALIVAAPLFEELFVRGFLLEGLRRGPLGDAGAIVLTSIFWASIHIQYELVEIAVIIIFGLVLGLARVLCDSLWVPIAMHVLANLVATIETYVIGGS
jgi:membrane protease YdiL (CAAX protease family)